MTERWADVIGYEGRYRVSDRGRVQSLTYGHWRWLKGSVNRGGYVRVGLTRAGEVEVRHALLHQMVLGAFQGPRPVGYVVRHLNGVPSDNRLENLAYGTPSQNTRDMVDHGRHKWANVTHCPRGHAYDGTNTYVRPNGSRKCRTCHRDWERARHQSRRAVT